MYSSNNICFCLFFLSLCFSLNTISSIHHWAHHTRKHLRHLFLHVSGNRRTASFGGHRGHGRGECRWVQWCGFGCTFQRCGQPGRFVFEDRRHQWAWVGRHDYGIVGKCVWPLWGGVWNCGFVEFNMLLVVPLSLFVCVCLC